MRQKLRTWRIVFMSRKARIFVPHQHATVKRQNARDMEIFSIPFSAWTYTNHPREKRRFFRPKRATPSKGRGPQCFAAHRET
jgi:hypothetical protein